MKRVLTVIVLCSATMLHTRVAHGEPATTGVDVCVAIDEARDSLSAQDRASVVLLLDRQFELAGWRVVIDGCSRHYVLSHVRLGAHIFVTLVGNGGSREGIAWGLDDLPALYSQMVRSIVTGRPMTDFNVVDRRNVTTAQAHANRVHTDRYAYARLGYGAVVGDRIHGTPAFGFGYRAELDALALDVSFFNIQGNAGGYGAPGASAFSLVKLQALRFLNPTANATPYVGGGLSWGATSFSGGPNNVDPDSYSSGWNGNGLQAELTVGYELPRATTLRVFVEGNVVLPFYRVRSARYSPSQRGAPDVSSRYAPSFVASVGLGWQRE
jgi:hypothetical protein